MIYKLQLNVGKMALGVPKSLIFESCFHFSVFSTYQRFVLYIHDVCRVHSIPDPSGETIVMNSEDYKRIMKNAQVTSLEDQKELENIKMTERNLRVEAANIRKREMQVLELSRRKHEKLSDLEQVRLVVQEKFLHLNEHQTYN